MTDVRLPDGTGLSSLRDEAAKASSPKASIPSAVDLALEAYDLARCRLNDKWHGVKCAPMSDANRDFIRPMIAEACAAYWDVQETRLWSLIDAGCLTSAPADIFAAVEQVVKMARG